MTDKHEFIARDLMPIAGDFAGDYDWEAIANEAGECDGDWRLRESIQDDLDANGYSDELNDILAKHDLMSD
jgi:hypothetical protein